MTPESARFRQPPPDIIINPFVWEDPPEALQAARNRLRVHVLRTSWKSCCSDLAVEVEAT